MRRLISPPPVSFFFIASLAFFFIVTSSHADSEFEIHYTKGIKAHAEGNPGKASKELTQAVKLNPQNKEANYALGVVYFDLGKYTKALKSFNVVHKSDKRYKNLSYRVALSYYSLGRYKLAQKFFKRELETTDNQNIKDECHFYLGKTYDKTEKKELAQKEFSRVSNRITSEPPKAKGKRWFLNASPGYQYDSNVAVIAKGVAIPSDVSGKGSSRILATFLGGAVPLLKQNTMISASYRYYQGLNLQNNLDSFDVSQHKISIDTAQTKLLKKRAVRLLTSCSYELSLISRNFNFYSQFFEIKPRLQIIWNKSWTSELRFQIAYNDFYEALFPEDNRNALNAATGIETSYVFNKSKSKVYLGFDYERNFAKGYNFNYNGFMPSAGFESSKLWIISKFNLDFAYARKNFVNFTPLPRRKDNIFIVSGSISRKIFRKFDININESFIYTESIQGYSYKRHIFSLMFGVYL